jgi:hypothetical protein
MGTVPPTAPENDWSDLDTSDFAHQPKKSEAPVGLSEAPPSAAAARAAIAPEPAPEPQGAPRAEDDWFDVAAETTTPKPALVAEDDWSDVAAETATGTAAVAVVAAASAPPLSQAADADPSEAVPAEEPAVADDDWSDVAASLEQPLAAAADSGDDEAAASSEGFDENEEIEPKTGAGKRPTELQSDNRQERLRTLNVVEQLKIARRGELSDRVVIERLYGKQVWEALLQNPRITLPEVARIARKGTVPKPLIEQIVENNQWIKEPNVRRALLSNPKLTADGVLKLLKMMPKHELKVMEKATAFPMTVRDAARKLLREGSQ